MEDINKAEQCHSNTSLITIFWYIIGDNMIKSIGRGIQPKF